MSKVNIYDIERFPFSTEGYERTQDLFKTKFDKTSKIVNAYMKNIMAQPTLHGSKPNKNHQVFKNGIGCSTSNPWRQQTRGAQCGMRGFASFNSWASQAISINQMTTRDGWDFPQFVKTEGNGWTRLQLEIVELSEVRGDWKKWRAKNIEIQSQLGRLGNQQKRNKNADICAGQIVAMLNSKTLKKLD